MTVSIGPGWSIGPGVALGGDGGGGSPVTYTSGVDYSPNGLEWNAFTGLIVIQPANWSNTAGATLVQVQPSGTVFTVNATVNGVPSTGTLTTTGGWSDAGGGIYTAPVTNAGLPNPFPASWQITSVTFTPA